MEDNCWMLQGECCFEPPSGYYGFIYKITDDQGRVYFGKKAFFHNQKKKITKKVIKATKTRKRVERVQKDSEWLSYWGSCKPLLQYMEDFPSRISQYKREILVLCKDKANLSYWEMVVLVKENVLFRGDCWNSNVSGKYFKGKIQHYGANY